MVGLRPLRSRTIVRGAAILGFTGVAELRERVAKDEMESSSGRPHQALRGGVAPGLLNGEQVLFMRDHLRPARCTGDCRPEGNMGVRLRVWRRGPPPRL